MALIGTIAINMTARTEQMTRAMDKGAAAVKGFGAAATKSVGGFGALIAETGRATAAVVNQFYVKPFLKAARAIGGVGKQIGASLAGAGKGLAGPLGRAGGMLARVVGPITGPIAAAGRATAGVVDEFYIKPFLKAARVVGGVGKQIGASLGSVGRGLAGPLGRAGGMLEGLAGGLARASMGVVPLAKGIGVMGAGFARLGLRAAATGLRLVASAAGKAASMTREAANVLGRGAAIGGAVAAVGLYKAARAASSLAEQTDRARVLFGKDADIITAKANLLGDSFGIVKSEFVGAASEMGGMLQGMGYGAADAAKLGAHFAQLATDVASATQTSVPEAMERMRSGLAGEAEAVRKWGVDLTEANLKIQAVRLGIAKTGVELTQTQKIQVRSILMDEKLAYAKGNLAKTAGGAENATKGLMGRLENLAATVGTALLPIVGSAMVELQTGVEALSMTWQAWTKGVVNDQVGVVGAVGETAGAMGYLQKAVGFVADEFQVVKMGFFLVQSYITSGIAKIVDSFAALANAIDYAVEKFGGARLGIGDFLNTYSADLKRLSESQYGSYQDELAKSPASDTVNAAFAAAQARIKGMQAEAMKPGVDVTKLAPKSEAAEKKAAEPKFASAAEAGSKEAANAILRSRYGGDVGKGPEETTAKNTAETNRILNRMANSMAAGNVTGSVLASIF